MKVKLLKRMTWPGVILLIVVVLIVFGVLVPITAQTQIIELLKVVTWPALVIIIMLVFHKPIKDLVKKVTGLTVELPVGKLTFTIRETEAILEAMLVLVDSLIEDMAPEERQYFIQMKDVPTPVPDDFERDISPEHKILQNLRRKNLIRPSAGGRWEKGKLMEITPFGRLVLQIRREQIKERAPQVKPTPNMSVQ